MSNHLSKRWQIIDSIRLQVANQRVLADSAGICSLNTGMARQDFIKIRVTYINEW
jgi:hypothetical protein